MLQILAWCLKNIGCFCSSLLGCYWSWATALVEDRAEKQRPSIIVVCACWAAALPSYWCKSTNRHSCITLAFFLCASGRVAGLHVYDIVHAVARAYTAMSQQALHVKTIIQGPAVLIASSLRSPYIRKFRWLGKWPAAAGSLNVIFERKYNFFALSARGSCQSWPVPLIHRCARLCSAGSPCPAVFELPCSQHEFHAGQSLAVY